MTKIWSNAGTVPVANAGADMPVSRSSADATAHHHLEERLAKVNIERTSCWLEWSAACGGRAGSLNQQSTCPAHLKTFTELRRRRPASRTIRHLIVHRL